jgi:hypothetical protein
MSKTGRTNYRRRYITVRSERRNPPDLRKLSRAAIAIALEDAEKKAEARAAMNGTDLSDGHSDPSLEQKPEVTP